MRASSVRFDEDSMWVELSDGRTLGVPLAWFPRLLHGTPAQREQVTTSSRGLHWEVLDEDISIAGLLAGNACWPGMREKEAMPDGSREAGRQVLIAATAEALAGSRRGKKARP